MTQPSYRPMPPGTQPAYDVPSYTSTHKRALRLPVVFISTSGKTSIVQALALQGELHQSLGFLPRTKSCRTLSAGHQRERFRASILMHRAVFSITRFRSRGVNCSRVVGLR